MPVLYGFSGKCQQKKTHKKQKYAFCVFFLFSSLEVIRQELLAAGKIVCGVDEPLQGREWAR